MKLYIAIVNERPVVATSEKRLEELLWEQFGMGDYPLYEVELEVRYTVKVDDLIVED